MNTEISFDKLMEFFVDTIQKCGIYLQDASDEEIEYNVFEELDVGIISFLHDDSLQKLKESNLISNKITIICTDLRKKFIELQNTELWNVESVRNSEKWKNILELSDEIKMLLE